MPGMPWVEGSDGTTDALVILGLADKNSDNRSTPPDCQDKQLMTIRPVAPQCKQKILMTINLTDDPSFYDTHGSINGGPLKNNTSIVVYQSSCSEWCMGSYEREIRFRRDLAVTVFHTCFFCTHPRRAWATPYFM